jgi:hypothetical protein
MRRRTLVRDDVADLRSLVTELTPELNSLDIDLAGYRTFLTGLDDHIFRLEQALARIPRLGFHSEELSTTPAPPPK